MFEVFENLYHTLVLPKVCDNVTTGLYLVHLIFIYALQVIRFVTDYCACENLDCTLLAFRGIVERVEVIEDGVRAHFNRQTLDIELRTRELFEQMRKQLKGLGH